VRRDGCPCSWPITRDDVHHTRRKPCLKVRKQSSYNRIQWPSPSYRLKIPLNLKGFTETSRPTVAVTNQLNISTFKRMFLYFTVFVRVNKRNNWSQGD
jgi:hypothetical protein